MIGSGVGVGSGVGAGNAVGVGSGVGVGTGVDVGMGVGSKIIVGGGCGVGTLVGTGAGTPVGSGVGSRVGSTVGLAPGTGSVAGGAASVVNDGTPVGTIFTGVVAGEGSMVGSWLTAGVKVGTAHAIDNASNNTVSGPAINSLKPGGRLGVESVWEVER